MQKFRFERFQLYLLYYNDYKNNIISFKIFSHWAFLFDLFRH